MEAPISQKFLQSHRREIIFDNFQFRTKDRLVPYLVLSQLNFAREIHVGHLSLTISTTLTMFLAHSELRGPETQFEGPLRARAHM